MDDLVSIITPSYNTGKYIAETIESVLAQSHSIWEMIIVDDGSTDDTDSVVKRYLSDKRIRYIKNDKNSGAAAARNLALREAKGKWIAFLDSDDVWMPDKLEKQIGFMKKGGHHFSYTYYEEIDENSHPLGVTVKGPKRVTEHDMYNYCWPGCLTVMYDAEYIGLIQIENIKKNHDYAMWLKVCKTADCYLLDEVLARYRRGRQGGISTQKTVTLIKWHYRLFRICDGRNVVSAVFHTLRNLIFGAFKKIKYVKG